MMLAPRLCYDPSMKTLIITSVALALAASTAQAAGSSAKNGFFKTPDNKIWCGWGTGSFNFIVCGVHNGFLRPKPKNDCAKEHVDYVGNRIVMTGKRKARVQACAGDAGPFANPPATKKLAYGKKWKRGPFTCMTETKAVFCRSKSGHGFFLGVHGYVNF